MDAQKKKGIRWKRIFCFLCLEKVGDGKKKKEEFLAGLAFYVCFFYNGLCHMACLLISFFLLNCF